MKTALLLSLLLGLPVASVAGPTSRDLALMGRVTWSAFACSVFASLMKDEDESKRLFFVGYEQGKAFIHALSSGNIQREDLRKHVPWGVTSQLEGPNPDFMIGRVYATAEDWAIEQLTQSTVGDPSDEARRIAAQGKFLSGNCGLIGKSK